MEPATQPGEDLSGKQLGDFRLLRRLGQGGMGQVYLADQLSLKRKVAVKIMRTDVSVTAASFQRFQAEAMAVAQLTHANIVQVYAIGEEHGLHYMALEYVEGRNLREYLDKKGPLELPLALSIMRQVAAALQRAGELGIIHRDIKPENILLTRRGEAKVADFGLSRYFAGEQPGMPPLTQTGIAMGTPLYMSPEQIQGETLDPRTDIYSFGVTCYHMLAGQPPFRGDNPFELALQHVQKEPEPLAHVRADLPVELCAVIQRMMAKAPSERYASCGELLKDLSRVRGILAGQQTLASGLTVVSPSQPELSITATEEAPRAIPTARYRGTLLGVAGTILLALLCGGTLAWLRDSAPRAESPPWAAPLEPGPTELQKQEKFLRDAVEQYAKPAGDRAQLELGLRHNLELGQFYLKNHRLEDADQFFTSLINNPGKVESYRTLGRLGHAIVLAKQDRPEESNRVFLELLREKSPQGRPADRLPFFLNQPELRRSIGRALDQNQANMPGQPLAPELKALRDPPKGAKKG